LNPPLFFFLLKQHCIKSSKMQDILKEYGPALITVIAILALIALVVFLIGSDTGSVVGEAFSNLIKGFFDNSTKSLAPAIKP